MIASRSPKHSRNPFANVSGSLFIFSMIYMYKTRKILPGIQIVKVTPVVLFVTSPIAAPTARPTGYASPASSSPKPRLLNVLEDSLDFLSKVVDSSGVYAQPAPRCPGNTSTCYQYILTSQRPGVASRIVKFIDQQAV